MERVTRFEFFSVVGPLNVHPSVDMRTIRDRHMASDWIMQDGSRRIIGRSVGSGDAVQFYLVPNVRADQ